MAEQAGGGTGEQVLESGGRAPGKSGPSIGAAPGWFGSQPATRAASGLRPGAIPPCQELADGGHSALRIWPKFWPKRQNRGPSESLRIRSPKSAARRRSENAAAERREAHPARVMGWVISGDPEIGPTARRAMGAAFRTSACRRSAPLIFLREQKKTRGNPAPSSNRAMLLGCLTIESGM